VKLRAIFTDLDGTLLEPDGSVTAEAVAALAWLADRRTPVFAVTSKTAAEIALLVRGLQMRAQAGFENGAGVSLPDGTIALHPSAVPLVDLLTVARALGRVTGAPLRTLLDLDDAELSERTGLVGVDLQAARQRRATLPLVVEPEWDEVLRGALPTAPKLRLLRGNRFLHLQGDHDKADAVAVLIGLVDQGDGRKVAFGDSPNDVGLLAAADVAVIIPSAEGPNPELIRRFPGARVASLPHGRGWAKSAHELAGGQ